MKFCPTQIVPLFTVMVGFGLTVKLLGAKACDKQPAALVPDIVKLALLVGLTTALPPCMV